MTDKSYVKILLKKGVSGGTGYEGEICLDEGRNQETMNKLIEDYAKSARKLIDEKF